MKTAVKTGDPASFSTPVLALFLFEEDTPDLTGREELAGLKEMIGPRLKQKDFVPEHLKTRILFPETAAGPKRIILVGLGPKDNCDVRTIKAGAAKAAQEAQDLGQTELTLLVPPSAGKMSSDDMVAEAAAMGLHLGAYRYLEYKTRDREKTTALESVTLLFPGPKVPASVRQAVKNAEITAGAVCLVRDLVNRPSGALYPEALAAEAEKLAEELNLKIRILDMAEAEKRGMGAFLGVAQGSRRPGRIIVLEYNGADSRKQPVALVGKAITFDSGGLSLKPAEGMGNMKTDMAGGAAVLGTIAAAARSGLKVNLVGIVPAAENMPDGGAYRPGDILTSSSGLTIEITNTDAEGRLVLADGITLALEYNPRFLIDLATLTGACVVALGEKCAGIMGNAPDLIDKLRQASDDTGERIWPLPLFDDYFEIMKSDVADFKNAGTRYAGTITAGLFLKQFVGKTDWAHLDIAGPARAEKASADISAGGTGFGVQLLMHFLRNLKF